MATVKTVNAPRILISPDQAEELFDLSLKLADLTENLLEQQAAYSKKFLMSLKRSIQQAKQGKVIRLSSLKDLA